MFDVAGFHPEWHAVRVPCERCLQVSTFLRKAKVLKIERLTRAAAHTPFLCGLSRGTSFLKSHGRASRVQCLDYCVVGTGSLYLFVDVWGRVAGVCREWRQPRCTCLFIVCSLLKASSVTLYDFAGYVGLCSESAPAIRRD